MFRCRRAVFILFILPLFSVAVARQVTLKNDPMEQIHTSDRSVFNFKEETISIELDFESRDIGNREGWFNVAKEIGRHRPDLNLKDIKLDRIEVFAQIQGVSFIGDLYWGENPEDTAVVMKKDGQSSSVLMLFNRSGREGFGFEQNSKEDPSKSSSNGWVVRLNDLHDLVQVERAVIYMRMINPQKERETFVLQPLDVTAYGSPKKEHPHEVNFLVNLANIIQVKLVGQRGDLEILDATVTFSNGETVLLPELHGSLIEGESLTASWPLAQEVVEIKVNAVVLKDEIEEKASVSTNLTKKQIRPMDNYKVILFQLAYPSSH